MNYKLNWTVVISTVLAITACEVTDSNGGDDPGIVPSATEGVYVLCEGGWGHGNASLWHSNTEFDSISANVVKGLTGEDLGDTGQSLYQHANTLYIVLNASNEIVMLDLSGDTVVYAGSVDLPNASPREMVIVGDKAYVSAWNLTGLAVVDLSSLSVVDTIPLGGLPEDVVAAGSTIYIAITMDASWASNDKVMVVDAATGTVTDTLVVGTGANQLLIDGNLLYVSRQWYEGYDSYRGISRVDLSSGNITSQDWGVGGGVDIFLINGQLFAATGEGVVSVNTDLSVGAASFAGSLAVSYSAGTDGTHIIIGSITDYESAGEIAVYETNGTLVETFGVGVIPGSILSYTRN